MLLRRVAATVGAAALGLAGIVMAAPAATAAAGDCPSGYVCMWEDANYSGSMYVRQLGSEGGYEIDWWNGDNEISSVVNRTGGCVVLYDNDQWSGAEYHIGKGASLSTLGAFDNRAESYYIELC